MLSWRALLFLLMASLWGCSTVKPVATGAAVGFKELDVWVAEGNIEIKGADDRQQMNFTWTQRGTGFTLDLRDADERTYYAIRYQGEPGRITAAGPWVTAGTGKGPDMAVERFRAIVPVAWFSSWLLGQAASPEAVITKGKYGEITQVEEGGWKVGFKTYMLSADYRLPEEIEIQGNNGTRLKLKVLRAETAFVDGCCEDERTPAVADESLKDSWAAKDDAERVAIKEPEPLWVSDEAFRAQLIKLHGEIPDPKVGLYGPSSMMWKVLKYVAPPGLGAGRALLLQTAHPWITIGIDEHSTVRDNPLERGRRTFRNITAMVFGTMPQAMAAADYVRRAHDKVQGDMKYDAGAFKKGSEYRANEINAMIWVHATLWETVVHMYERVERPLTAEEKERFYQETKLFAMLFGIPAEALPADWEAFMAYNRAMWDSPQLTVTPATKTLAKYLFKPKNILLIPAMSVQKTFTAANLPPRLREDYGMSYGFFRRANYKFLLFSARIADRLLPKSLRYNPGYNQAMARLEGKETGLIPRTLLKIGVGSDRVVN